MNGLKTFWPNLGFFINRLNRFNAIAGCLYQPWGTPDLSLSGSHSSGLRIENRFFCLFPYSVRNFLTKFGIFYQPPELVGNRFNRFSTIASCLCLPWGTPDLSLSGSHSSRFGIENRFFFFLFPYSVRNFLAKFGIFYQPYESVGNQFNRFSTIASCLCQPWGTLDLSLSGSHSSGLGIENRFFCLLPQSLMNFLTEFGIFLSIGWIGWEPVQPIQHHSWLPLSAMRNTCFSLSGSHSSERLGLSVVSFVWILTHLGVF